MSASCFFFQNRKYGLAHDFKVERDAVDPLLDEVVCEHGEIARGLSADAKLASFGAADGYDLGGHLFHSGIPFIKNGRDDLAVAVHSENQLV